MRFDFRFRWIPFIAMLLVASIGIALGEWQRGRAEEKDALAGMMQQRTAMAPITLPGAAPLAPVAELEFRRVRAEGEFLSDWPVYLDNRPHAGAQGFYQAMPFKTGNNGPIVMVLRGWLPRDPAERTRLPAITVPAGRVTIEGTIRRGAGQIMQLGEPPALTPGAIVQNLSLADFAKASGMQVLPFIIEQADAAGGAAGMDQLVRDWPRPSAGSDKHRGYAFQWYALAATALVFFLVTGLRRGTK